MRMIDNKIKGVMIIGIIFLSCFITAFVIMPVGSSSYTYGIYSFSSYDELVDFLDKNYENYTNNGWGYSLTPRAGFTKSIMAESLDSSSNGGNLVDFSKTNIQVEGVDEPDIVKTDGTYLYIVVDNKIFIVKAFPANEAIVYANITLDSDVSPTNLFINKDRLIVFGDSYTYPDVYGESCWWGGISTTIITIFDIADRKNPEIIKEIEVDGVYFDSRMIKDIVYVITNEYSYHIHYEENSNNTLNIPEITIDDKTTPIPADQIYYVDIPERLDTMTYVISINIYTEEVNQKSFLLGSAQSLYVSKDNIFLAYTKYQYFYPRPLMDTSINQNLETTILHKISIKDGNISYAAQGEVPGRILNQFSMDEHNGFFRIATTIGNVWDQNLKSSNNVYILDKDLKRVSEIEDIASGERIYSARFMGDKGYLVTFKKIDPFFTIDLSDPYNPKILGKLKIPGYSDYLHPYDENHIIGIGKDTVEALDSQKEFRDLDFAWYQGLKIALFDISDFENPKEVAKIVIGDRGTDSPALYDHKAFLFDKEKQLLVIPVTLCEISDEIKQQYDNYTGSMRGEFTFQGAYVYQLSIGNGFEYKGRITHLNNEDIVKSGFYGYWGSSSIMRTLYVDEVLYTISGEMVKMNNLNSLIEINSIDLV